MLGSLAWKETSDHCETIIYSNKPPHICSAYLQASPVVYAGSGDWLAYMDVGAGLSLPCSLDISVLKFIPNYWYLKVKCLISVARDIRNWTQIEIGEMNKP